MKKYELTNEKKTLLDGTVLHRIRALRDIPRFGVKAGELGGFVEGEINLLQDGDAWVFCNANVYENACVYGDAKVSGDAWVYGDAKVSGDAKACGNAKVYGNSLVCDDAMVYDDARVYDNAKVRGYAKVYDNAKVRGYAKVCGYAKVYGDAEVCSDAKVCDTADYITFKNSWSSGRWFTYTRSNKMWRVGCFHGTGEELVKKAYADSELSGRCYEAIVRAVETIEAAKAEAKGEAK